jgi:hypothetical protein
MISFSEFLSEGGGRPSRQISDPARREIAHLMNVRRHQGKMSVRADQAFDDKYKSQSKVTGAKRKVGVLTKAGKHLDTVEAEYGDIEGVKNRIKTKRAENTKAAKQATKDFATAKATVATKTKRAKSAGDRNIELVRKVYDISRDRQIKAARANAPVIPRSVNPISKYGPPREPFPSARATNIDGTPNRDRRKHVRDLMKNASLRSEP